MYDIKSSEIMRNMPCRRMQIIIGLARILDLESDVISQLGYLGGTIPSAELSDHVMSGAGTGEERRILVKAVCALQECLRG